MNPETPEKNKAAKETNSGKNESGNISQDKKSEVQNVSVSIDAAQQILQEQSVINLSQTEVDEKAAAGISQTDEQISVEKNVFWKIWKHPYFFSIVTLVAQAIILLIFSAPLDVSEKWITYQLSALNSPPDVNNRVEVIDIQDDDRRTLFNSQNDPLNPQKLYEIVEIIAKNEPKIIGVDIDTSNEQFKSLKLTKTDIPIVWAETPRLDENEKIIGTLDPVGGSVLPDGHYSGIPATLKDTDNVQRFYQRFVEVGEEKSISLPFKIKSLLNPESEQSSAVADNDMRYITFVNEKQEAFRPHISARELLEKTGAGDPAIRKLLEGKIVLLGGSFSGQDQTETPVGKMLGIDLQATIVETELNGGGRSPLNFIIKAIFIIITAIVLLLVFHRFDEMLKAISWSLLIIVIVTVLIGIFSQDLIGTIILFGAFILSLLSQIVDKTRDYFKQNMQNLKSGTESATI